MSPKAQSQDKAQAAAEEKALDLSKFQDKSMEESAELFENQVVSIVCITDNSPQLDPDSEIYIEAAKVGDMNLVGTDYIAKVMQFLPCRVEQFYCIMGGKNKRRVMAARKTEDEINAIIERVAGEDFDGLYKDEEILVRENIIFFGMLEMGNDLIPAIIRFKATQLRKAYRWLKMTQVVKLPDKLGGGKAPMFHCFYNIDSMREFNEKGKWYGFRIRKGQTLKEYCEERGYDVEEYYGKASQTSAIPLSDMVFRSAQD